MPLPTDLRELLSKASADADAEARRAIAFADAMRTLAELSWSADLEVAPMDRSEVERRLTGEALIRWQLASEHVAASLAASP